MDKILFLGGVPDVDQDTYVLTESAGADEDVFNSSTGVNSLSIAQDKLHLELQEPLKLKEH